ncbi:DNA-binding protein [Mycobacterium camsae]|uniref:DNA-binding protein n=1 Tax=Mycobacterium gordonae TaxID=1778 RepID=UPI00197EB906|nr:DNA-binding protein [Mycobacterium gordonae]
MSGSSEITKLKAEPLPSLATPQQVAEALHTTAARLAQDRYRGTGPRFIKHGRRVLYRWTDVHAYLDANTVTRTDDPRGVVSA